MIDTDAAVGGIPPVSVAVLEDKVDAVVHNALRIEIFVSDEDGSEAGGHSEVHATRIGRHPEVAPMVAQQAVDTVALQTCQWASVGVERLSGLLPAGVETVYASAVDAKEQGGAVPGQDGAHRHQGQMQTRLGDGREGAVVDSHDAIVEGTEPQTMGSRVVIGAEH